MRVLVSRTWLNHLKEILFANHFINIFILNHYSKNGRRSKGIKTPPKFDGLNFLIWKVKMTKFLQSLGKWVTKAVTKPFSVPADDEDIWSDITTKKFDDNA